MDALGIEQFQAVVYDYYNQSGRHYLPWRQTEPDGSFDPYKIVVSELMLQQTQVSRVVPKYEAFLSQFPTNQSLAQASLGDVLRAWSGLGYNRRAQYLYKTAQAIEQDYAGQFPHLQQELVMLPGIGSNTAGAIVAYAYNQPSIFVETNIRSVVMHHFFQDQTAHSDKDVVRIVGQILDKENPRHWYWAVMDYGSYLKQQVGNTSRRSKHYRKQSKFQGSDRQIRGQIIRLLGASDSLSLSDLEAAIVDQRVPTIVDQLFAEKLILRHNNRFSL